MNNKSQWRRLGSAAAALILVVSMSPMGVYAGIGRGVSAPASAESTRTAVQTQEETTPAIQANPMDDQEYKEFRLPVYDIEAEHQDEEPMNGAQPPVYSRLYMGYGNKNSGESGTGYFSVFNTMNFLNDYNATITDPNSKINGNLSNNRMSPYMGYEHPSAAGKGGIKLLNAISLDMGNTQEPMIAEVAIYEESKKNKKTTDYRSAEQLRIKMYDVGLYRQVYTLDTALSAWGSQLNGVCSVGTNSRLAVTSMAAGDYDGDGLDELAVYIPSKLTDYPYITVYDVSPKDGKIQWKQDISLKDLSDGDLNQYKSAGYPPVSLSTTTIAGREDLVISVCMPRSMNIHTPISQKPALAIYSGAPGSMKQVFIDHMDWQGANLVNRDGTATALNGDRYMRFASATDADLDGDGEKELIVAGYLDDYDGVVYWAIPPFSYYGLNMVVWNGTSYEMVLSKPLAFKPQNPSLMTIDSEALYDERPGEPVALTAARLDGSSASENLFLEGLILSFGTDSKSKDQKTRLQNLNMTFEFEMSLSDKQSGSDRRRFVSQAVGGSFAKDRGSSEQIVVVWEDQGYPKFFGDGHPIASIHIAWLWKDSNGVTQHNTNSYFINERSAYNDGLFVTICPVEDTTHEYVYEYQGKTYGWSMPQPLVAMSALPAYDELYYPDGPGDVSYTVSTENSTSDEVQISIQPGITFEAEASLGIVTITGDIGVAAGPSAAYQKSRTMGSSLTIGMPKENEDYVVYYAMPMVCYQYLVDCPPMTITKEMVDNYQKATGLTSPYRAGETVPAGKYPFYIWMEYDPLYEVMPVDEFNELVLAHKEDYKNSDGTPAEPPVVDMSKLTAHTPGDPTSYAQDLMNYAGYAASDTRLKSYQTGIHGGNSGSKTLSLDIEKGKEVTIGGGLSFDAALQAAVGPELSFGLKLGFKVAGGGKISVETSYGRATATVNGNAVEALFNALPVDNNTGYDFAATMGMWENPEENGVPLVMGFATSNSGQRSLLPPLPPSSPYVYQADQNHLKLSWDLPDPDDPRSAEAYSVYQKTDKGLEYLGSQFATDNVFTVAQLNTDSTYQFFFKGLKGVTNIDTGEAAQVSGLSNPLTGATDADLPFTVQPQSQNSDPETTDTVRFEAKAEKENYAIDYRWYEWQNKVGRWSEVKDGSERDGASYSVEKTADGGTALVIKDLPQSLNGARYYVEATAKYQGEGHAPALTAQSAVAELFVTGYQISLKLADGDTGQELVPLADGSFYTPEDQPVDLTAQVNGLDGKPAVNGSLRFAIGKEGTSAVNYLPSDQGVTPDIGGEAAAEWIPEEEGDYLITVEYLDGSGISSSHTLAIRVGPMESSYLTISYDLNGGKNDPANPEIIGKDAAPIPLAPAVRADAVFEGWYSDPEFTRAVTQVDPDSADSETGIITLHAKWDEDAVPQDDALPFEDLNPNAWYYDTVRRAYENGLLNGVDGSNFKPKDGMNRAMLASVLHRIADQPDPDGKPSDYFDDVPDGKWYSDAVAWAAENKIITGHPDGTYRPNDTVTREQLAAAIHNMSRNMEEEGEAPDGDLSEFVDSDEISDWAVDSVDWATDNDLINGRDDNSLDPAALATRAETAVVLQAFQDKFSK